MPDDVIKVDLPDGATLSILEREGRSEAVEQVRRELRLWARLPLDARTAGELTRSSTAAVLGQVAESLGTMIASGVVGNAAWAAFPKAADLLTRVSNRGHIRDAVRLAEKLREALSHDPMSTSSELVEAQQLAAGGWDASVRVDGKTLDVVTDRTGNIVLWRPAPDS